MKLFGIILLTSYFLVRERQTAFQGLDLLKLILKDGCVYFACALFAICGGWLYSGEMSFYQPAAILLAAALPAIIFNARVVCMLGGAFTAFFVLRFIPNAEQVFVPAAIAGLAILTASFFYAGACERLRRLPVPALMKKPSQYLLILFGLALFISLILQKIVQLY